MTLNNKLKKRKNIAMTYYNNEWKMVWYILAYQWKSANGKQCIYVPDLAVMKEYQWQIWWRLLLSLISKLKKEWLDDLPIMANARENTSYAIIKDRAEKFWLELKYDKEVEYGNWEKVHNIVLAKKWKEWDFSWYFL